MDRIKTYVINLPKDLERKESILKETGRFFCLDIELVKAVYGKELTDREKNDLFDIKKYGQYYRRFLLPGEIGSTLSHRDCYRRLMESGGEFALIMEDDARFMEGVFTEQFSIKVVDFMKSPEPKILLLHADFESIGKRTVFSGKYHLYPVYKALFSTAYLINKSAACLMLKRNYPYWVADDWHLFRRWGIRIYSLYPSAVIQQWDKFNSSIVEEKNLYRKRNFLPRSWVELHKAFDKVGYLFLKKIGLVKHLQD